MKAREIFEKVVQEIAQCRRNAVVVLTGDHNEGFSEASGHVDRRVQLQTMPGAFEWVWKGYKATGH